MGDSTTRERHQKLPISRQDWRQVKAWLASLQADANARPGFRDGGYGGFRVKGMNPFPTNGAAIRRFFHYCQRHKLDPADRLSYCLYWGVCEPNKSMYGDKSHYPAIFRSWSPAILEHVVNNPTSYLRSEDSEDNFDDIYKVVIEVFKPITQEERENPDHYSEYEYRYDRHSGETRYSPGRIYQVTVKITLGMSCLFSYRSKEDSQSVVSHVTASLETKIPSFSGHKFRAETQLTSQGGGLDDLIEALLAIRYEGSIPHEWHARVQPYLCYRSPSRWVYMMRKQNRWHNKQKRKERRAQARKNAGSTKDIS